MQQPSSAPTMAQKDSSHVIFELILLLQKIENVIASLSLSDALQGSPTLESFVTEHLLERIRQESSEGGTSFVETLRAEDDDCERSLRWIGLTAGLSEESRLGLSDLLGRLSSRADCCRRNLAGVTEALELVGQLEEFVASVPVSNRKEMLERISGYRETLGGWATTLQREVELCGGIVDECGFKCASEGPGQASQEGKKEAND